MAGFVNAPAGDPYRGNAAKIGGTYDPANDVFIDPKPYDRLGFKCQLSMGTTSS